ncbi:MAG: hypothetical protein HY457_02305 [Parcubacteria group bacterium]|nr:hypothetical protein [Parcubacteria group bacterium]
MDPDSDGGRALSGPELNAESLIRLMLTMQFVVDPTTTCHYRDGQS